MDTPAPISDDLYGKVTAPGTIRFERLLPAPVERVWDYLTESDLRGQWLASGEMDLTEGADCELFFQHSKLSLHDEDPPAKYAAFREGVALACMVLRVDEPFALALEWGTGRDASDVAFQLNAQDGQTRLVVIHSRLADHDALINVSAGWHAHLDILEDVLAHRAARPFWSTHTTATAEYEPRLPQDADGAGL